MLCGSIYAISAEMQTRNVRGWVAVGGEWVGLLMEAGFLFGVMKIF